jgi:O-methyltransferase
MNFMDKKFTSPINRFNGGGGYRKLTKRYFFDRCLAPFLKMIKFMTKKDLVVTFRTEMDKFSDDRKFNFELDYVRYRTLAFLAEMMRGDIHEDYCIAELGVYRGVFASRIQEEFIDKNFYLFDTFEGFSEKDKSLDLEKGFVKPIFFEKMHNHTRTSEAIVLSKMKFPENCKICKGRFPESIANIEKNIKWGFVSLDADLYQPILEGLRFFYPSLLPGGYIMLHDYNTELKGVRKAVEDFEAETSKICKVPIPDMGGTLIITK